MYARDLPLFADVVQRCGYDILFENDGFFKLQDFESKQIFEIQTNGFNFLAALNSFCRIPEVQDKLK